MLHRLLCRIGASKKRRQWENLLLPAQPGFGELGSLAPWPFVYIRKGNTCHPVARQFVKMPPGACGLRISHHTDSGITDVAELPVVYRFAP